MADAATTHVSWLTATAAHAEQAANHARQAAAAYETAYAMTVPPPMIEANRVTVGVTGSDESFRPTGPCDRGDRG
jgi:PPE-repeat protein